MNALKNKIITGANYRDVDLAQCVGYILLDYGFSDWTISLDKRIPAYRMQAFTPRYISVRQALEELAETYHCDLAIDEQAQVVQFTRIIASGGKSDV